MTKMTHILRIMLTVGWHAGGGRVHVTRWTPGCMSP